MSTLANFNINVTLPDGYDFPALASELSSNRSETLTRLARFFDRCAGGMEPGRPGETKIVLSRGSTQAAAVRAFGTITFTGASGTVGATVAGIAKTFTHGANDAADAASLKSAIDADATLNKLVTCTVAGAVVTITAKQPGVLGNQLTLAASGTGVAAGNVSSGKMQSGVGADGDPTTLSF
ncbi:MAG: hypothetical protein SFW67_28375 [Myxococcaceae bacterium]|nr:hypothetical protein [Myxococcaceae bacterium]